MPEEKKPPGWEKLRRDGDPEGPAQVGYDDRRHLNYFVQSDGTVVYQEKPPGFGFRAGVLAPTEPETRETAQTPAESVAEGIRQSEEVP